MKWVRPFGSLLNDNMDGNDVEMDTVAGLGSFDVTRELNQDSESFKSS
jgi:hypothetical protein